MRRSGLEKSIESLREAASGLKKRLMRLRAPGKYQTEGKRDLRQTGPGALTDTKIKKGDYEQRGAGVLN